MARAGNGFTRFIKFNYPVNIRMGVVVVPSSRISNAKYPLARRALARNRAAGIAPTSNSECLPTFPFLRHPEPWIGNI